MLFFLHLLGILSCVCFSVRLSLSKVFVIYLIIDSSSFWELSFQRVFSLLLCVYVISPAQRYEHSPNFSLLFCHFSAAFLRIVCYQLFFENNLKTHVVTFIHSIILLPFFNKLQPIWWTRRKEQIHMKLLYYYFFAKDKPVFYK